jgi:GNAT superfamily N-acetyltransferase
MGPGAQDRPVGGLSVRAPAGVELRPATRDDLPAVLRLLAERTAAPSMPLLGAPTRGTGQADDWDAFLGSVDAAPFLAVADGDAAGCLILAFRRRMNFATWEAWVPEIVVAEAFRGRGIGRALLRVAIEEWRLRRAHRLAVETWPGEEGGRALLAKLGFEETSLRFRAEPPRPGRTAAPNDVTIRRATGDDVDAATRLVAELGAHRSPVPDRMEAVGRAYRQLVARPTDRTLLAHLDGAPAGICTLELRGSLRDGGVQAWLPELVVTEPARDRGIGTALLRAALAEAAEAGARAAVAECGARRPTARHLFDVMGFRPAGSTFTLDRDR